MKHLTLAFLTLFVAQSASAATATYLCKMTKLDGHGWIAPEYAFQVDADKKTAMVADSPDWVEARLKNRGAKGYRMTWSVTRQASAGGNLRVRYQANLNPADNSVKVRMAFVSVNASNKPYGVGTCSLEK